MRRWEDHRGRPLVLLPGEVPVFAEDVALSGARKWFWTFALLFGFLGLVLLSGGPS